MIQFSSPSYTTMKRDRASLVSQLDSCSIRTHSVLASAILSDAFFLFIDVSFELKKLINNDHYRF